MSLEPGDRCLADHGLVFEDECTAATDALLDRLADTGATVPALWRLEVANAFQTAIRRQRIDAVYRRPAATLLEFRRDNSTSRVL